MAYDIVVVGSLVVDLTIWLPHHPLAGETVLADKARMFVGGKGANQAVQVQRLGGSPLLIGKIGSDPLGEFLIHGLKQDHLDLRGILTSTKSPTSYAVPVITPDSQYILHVAGSNRDLDVADVSRFESLIGRAKIVLVQGEVPGEVSLTAMRWAHRENALVLCDPAPVDGISQDMLHQADVLTPNQVEMAQLTGCDNPDNIDELARGTGTLFSRYPRMQLILVTLGKDGVLLAGRDHNVIHITAPTVHVVDPTGAGDAFNGAWAWAVSCGWTWEQATRLAVHVGSLAASKAGALTSLPTWNDLYSHYPEALDR